MVASGKKREKEEEEEIIYRRMERPLHDCKWSGLPRVFGMKQPIHFVF